VESGDIASTFLLPVRCRLLTDIVREMIYQAIISRADLTFEIFH
jgi:hypothetical protein